MPPIEPGEKFACLAFRLFSLAGVLPGELDLGYGCWALPSSPVPIEGHWKSWLGEIEADHIRESNLVFFASMGSATPVILDGENERLQNRVQYLQWGIILCGGVPGYEHGAIFSGGNDGEGPRIRTVGQVQRIYGTAETSPAEITIAHLTDGTSMVPNLERVLEENRSGGFRRLLRGTNALLAGWRANPADVRLHQCIRAVEALLPPGAWGRDAFVDHVRTFVSEAPDPTTILRELYQLRNIAEHHGDLERGLPNTSPGRRVAVANRRARQAESLARAVYRRVFIVNAGLLDRFRDEASITGFWAELPPARRALWGAGLDIHGVA